MSYEADKKEHMRTGKNKTAITFPCFIIMVQRPQSGDGKETIQFFHPKVRPQKQLKSQACLKILTDRYIPVLSRICVYIALLTLDN